MTITQEEVADYAGLVHTYISGIERGVRIAGLINIEKLANALGVPLHALFWVAHRPGVAHCTQYSRMLPSKQEARLRVSGRSDVCRTAKNTTG